MYLVEHFPYLLNTSLNISRIDLWALTLLLLNTQSSSTVAQPIPLMMPNTSTSEVPVPSESVYWTAEVKSL